MRDSAKLMEVFGDTKNGGTIRIKFQTGAVEEFGSVQDAMAAAGSDDMAKILLDADGGIPWMGISGTPAGVLEARKILAEHGVADPYLISHGSARTLLYSTAVAHSASGVIESAVRLVSLRTELQTDSARVAEIPIVAEVEMEPEEAIVTSKATLEQMIRKIGFTELTPGEWNGFSTGRMDISDALRAKGLSPETEVSHGIYTSKIKCPKCGADAVVYQQEQTASFFCGKCGLDWSGLQNAMTAKGRQEIDAEKKLYGSKDTPQWIPDQYEPGEGDYIGYKSTYTEPHPEEEFIPTGIAGLDKITRGLQLGTLNVLTGTTGAGKTSVTSEMILNLAQSGYSSVVYSGEMARHRIQRWMNRMAAGSSEVRYVKDKNYWFVPGQTENYIVDWLDKYVCFYKNECPQKPQYMLESLKNHLSTHKTSFVLIDNLMSLDIDHGQYGADAGTVKYLIDSLIVVAREYHVAILLVAHPRKFDGTLLTPYDVKGISEIGNSVDTILGLYRVSMEFKNSVKAKYKFNDNHEVFRGTNALHVIKGREAGGDALIPLYYEESTKRLKNTPDEYVHYAWEDQYIRDALKAFGVEPVDDRETAADKAAFDTAVNAEEQAPLCPAYHIPKQQPEPAVDPFEASGIDAGFAV